MEAVKQTNDENVTFAKITIVQIRHKCHQTLTKFTARGEKSHA